MESASCFFVETEQDEIFEENIDAFDKEMDNDDDGIEHSEIDDQFEEDSLDEDADDEDFIKPYDVDDEQHDYDELED